VKASYVASSVLPEEMEYFTDGQFMKECMVAVSELTFSRKGKIVGDTIISCFTVCCRIDDIAESMEHWLINTTCTF
jgi:hypothetical protein